MPAISLILKIIISVFASFAGIVFAIFSAILAADFKYWIKKSGTKPAKKTWIVWALYIISGLAMIIGPAVVAVAPSKVPLHYFVVVDSSARMNAMFPAGTSAFPAGTSKWDALQESIQELLGFTPDSDRYRLIVLGGNLLESTSSCNQKENKIVLDDREKIMETIKALKPGGVASLDNALEKIRKILSDIPDEQTTILYLFLGGGDECAKDEWKALRYFLIGTAGLLDKLYIEIILLPNEGETILGVSEIYKIIDKYDLTNVNVHSPENAMELEDLINSFGNNAQATAIATSQLSTHPAQPTYTPQPLQPTYTPQPLQPTHTSLPTQPTYTPLPPQSTYTPQPLQPTYTPLPPPNCVTWAWEFSTDGDSEGWQVGQGITLEVQEGYVMGDITQLSAFWVGPDNLDIDATVYKSLEMRYRVNSLEASDIAYFYWIKADDLQFGNNKRVKFDIQTDYEWHNVSVDLAQKSVNWNNIITSIRLYPAWFSDASALVEYDYIRLCY